MAVDIWNYLQMQLDIDHIFDSSKNLKQEETYYIMWCNVHPTSATKQL